MGEMADLILDSVDWWEEDGDYNPWVDGPFHPVVIPCCRYCKKHPLLWRKVNGKWRLHDSETKIHICKQFFQRRK